VGRTGAGVAHATGTDLGLLVTRSAPPVDGNGPSPSAMGPAGRWSNRPTSST